MTAVDLGHKATKQTNTLNLWGWVKRSKHFFLNGVVLHIKLKEKTNIEEKTLTLHTPLTLGQVERSDIEIVQISIFFIELSTKIVDRPLNIARSEQSSHTPGGSHQRL